MKFPNTRLSDKLLQASENGLMQNKLSRRNALFSIHRQKVDKVVIAIFLAALFVNVAHGSYNNVTLNKPRSSGRLLDIIVDGVSLLRKKHRHKIPFITIFAEKQKNKKPPVVTSTLEPSTEISFGSLFSYKASLAPTEDSNSLRNLIIPPATEDARRRGIRLAGSFLNYMGRVQMAIEEGQWGSICGEGWDIRDATVACRQLGFAVGGVVARPKMEFGETIGPVVMSRVNCRGHESSLRECPAERWDKVNSLPCPTHMKSAGLVCGCPMQIAPEIRTRCFLFTNFPFDTLFCRYSCPSNQALTGDPKRHCGKQQRWTGLQPQCVDMQSPCINNPCRNGGRCKEYLRESNSYECVCRAPYGGRNCEFERDWRCGRQSVQPNLQFVRPQLRIVGGKEATMGSWPWIVQIRMNEAHFCSGTLIAPQWVITAAHCLQLKNIRNGPINNTRWSVIVGQHDRLGVDKSGQRIEIMHAISHNYTNIHGDIPRRDIALLKLREPIRMDNVTSPICLPRSRKENPLANTKCWIAGWGETSSSGGQPMNLTQGDIPILSLARCRHKSDPNRSYDLIEDNMICAGYNEGGVDACRGDSGGPLMCPRADGSWYLAGIVSWGYVCAAPLNPGVYTKVSHYLNWIYSTMQSV